MARAKAVRGSGDADDGAVATGWAIRGGTSRQPAAELSALAAALRLPTKATSDAPAVSSGAAPVIPFRHRPRRSRRAIRPVLALA